MSLTELGNLPGSVESISQSAEYVSDPLIAFQQLCSQSKNAMLLESAEIESKDNLKSLILVDATLRLECTGQQVVCKALNSNGEHVLSIVQQHCPDEINCITSTLDGMPALILSCTPENANATKIRA